MSGGAARSRTEEDDMDRLSALDAAFLAIEDEHSPMAIGSVAVCDGPVPTDAEVRRLFEVATRIAPRYRQRLRFVPLGLSRPVWEDDPHFRLEDHVDRIALPAPGGAAELADLVGWVMSERLDRRRPLWESVVVEGLAGGRWALVSKLHHCLADGVSGSDLLTAVLVASNTPDVPGTGRPEQPEESEKPARPAASDTQLVLDAVGDLLRRSWREVVSVEQALSAPRRLLATVGTLARGARQFGALASPLPRSRLCGPISNHRRWTSTTVPMAELAAVKHAMASRLPGLTLNDVALTLTAGAYRRLQEAVGETPERHPVRTLVPVSTRPLGASAGPDNQVSALTPELPVDVEDPVERLTVVHRRMAELKASGEAPTGSFLSSLVDDVPWFVEEALLRASLVPSTPLLQTVTTNVPGPPVPLQVLGRRLVELAPYVPLGYQVRVGVAMLSYAGAFCFGVTADQDSVPDLQPFVGGISDELARLLDAVQIRPVVPAQTGAREGDAEPAARVVGPGERHRPALPEAALPA